MPKAYLYDSETKKFCGETDCQRDPLESEALGRDVFLMPGGATSIEPLEAKEGFDVVWNEKYSVWEYKESKKEEEPKPYEPTELDIANKNMWNARGKLMETDYVNDKINDALNTGNDSLAAELREKYKDIFAQREEWRKEVRKWESEIERLQAEQPKETTES